MAADFASGAIPKSDIISTRQNCLKRPFRRCGRSHSKCRKRPPACCGRLTPEEEADLLEAQAEMRRGEFATGAEVEAVFAKYRR